MNYPKTWLCIATTVLVAACTAAEKPEAQATVDTTTTVPASNEPVAKTGGLNRDSLLGAWSVDGENFVWVIDTATILFEADMQNHPYRISGDTLLIDRGDPSTMQKTRVLRLSRDTMVIQDVVAGTSEPLVRLR